MFQIDLMSRVPVYEQITEQLGNFVINGIISSGSQIPSVRSLSVQLSVNPNTIQKAYTELYTGSVVKTKFQTFFNEPIQMVLG